MKDNEKNMLVILVIIALLVVVVVVLVMHNKNKEKWSEPQSITFDNTEDPLSPTPKYPCIFYVYNFPFNKYPSGSGVPENPRPNIGDNNYEQEYIILEEILKGGERLRIDYKGGIPYGQLVFQLRPANGNKYPMSSNYKAPIDYYASYIIKNNGIYPSNPEISVNIFRE